MGTVQLHQYDDGRKRRGLPLTILPYVGLFVATVSFGIYLSGLWKPRIIDPQPPDPLVAEGRPESPAHPNPSAVVVSAVIHPGPALRERLAHVQATTDADGPTLRLILEGVRFPPDGPVGVRVFLNLPNADRNTPLDSEHFVDSLSSGHTDRPQNFVLDAGQAVRALGPGFRADAPLTVTLVAVPRSEDVDPAAARVWFDKAVLSAVDP